MGGQPGEQPARPPIFVSQKNRKHQRFVRAYYIIMCKHPSRPVIGRVKRGKPC